MAGIWTNTGEGWELGSPQPFQDEATLHKLIEQNPRLMPLAGSPILTILGSQIYLGTGYADMLAVESSGRPAIIEVKLAKSPEARRAIVSQVLAYAAFLHGLSIDDLEQGPLSRALSDAGYGSILNAVQDNDQEGAVDADTFTASMQQYLDQGNFRLVLVLDEISIELERLIAYLDAMTLQELTIDLISLKVYEVNCALVALPQRVTPGIDSMKSATTPDEAKSKPTSGVLSDGSDGFRASVAGANDETSKMFDRLIRWAEELAALPNVRLSSYAGKKRYTLLPRIMPDNAGLVTIWNDDQKPYISVWRPVFEKLAPNSIDPVEKVIAPIKIGRGNVVWDITPQLLEAVKKAYQEAGNR